MNNFPNFANAVKAPTKVITNSRQSSFDYPAVQITITENNIRLYELATEKLVLAKGDQAIITQSAGMFLISKAPKGVKGFKCNSTGKSTGVGRILQGSDSASHVLLGGAVDMTEAINYRICETPIRKSTVGNGEIDMFFLVPADEYTPEYEEAIKEQVANMAAEVAAEVVAEEVEEEDYV